MLDTWTLAVLALMNSSSAIWRLLRPSATRPSTSRSRGVRPSSSPGDGASGSLVSAGRSPIRARRASDSSSASSGRAPSAPVAAHAVLMRGAAWPRGAPWSSRASAWHQRA
jgi:hypothetical protein